MHFENGLLHTLSNLAESAKELELQVRKRKLGIPPPAYLYVAECRMRDCRLQE